MLKDDSQAERPEDETTECDTTPKPRKRRRWLKRLLVVVSVLVFLVAIAPTLLSTPPGRSLVCWIVNQQIKGKVSMDQLSLGWFKSARLGGIMVNDPQGRQVVSVGVVQWDRGLAKAIFSGSDLGSLTIDSPQITLIEQDGTISLQQAFEPRSEQPKKSKQEPANTTIGLKWSNGTVRVQRAGAPEYVVSDLSGELSVKGMNELLAKASAAPAGGGQLLVNASLRDFNAAGTLSLERATGQLTIVTEPEVNLGPVLALAEPKSPGQGRLRMNVKAQVAAGKGHGSYNIEVIGLAAPTGGRNIAPLSAAIAGELTIDGGVLRTRPTVKGDLGAVTADVHWPLASPPTGSMLPDFAVDVDGKINLAALAEAVPALLPLRPDAKVVSGSLDLEKISLRGGSQAAAGGTVRISLTTQRTGQQPRQWAPIELKVQADRDAAGKLELKHGSLNSSFATITASGRLPELTADLQVNLAEARSQLGDVIDLDNLDISGRVVGKLNAKAEQSETANEERTIVVEAMIDAENVKAGAVPPAGAPAQPGPKAVTGRVQLAAKATMGKDITTMAGSAEVVKLVVEGGMAPLGQEKPKLVFDVSLKPAEIAVAGLAVQSKLLSLKLNGSVKLSQEQSDLDLKGDYAIEWSQLGPMLEAAAPDMAKSVQLAGRSASDVYITGPISKPKIRQMNGAMALGWKDGSKVFGLLMGDATLKPQLSDGKIQVPATSMSASGGKVTLGCTVDMTGQEPELLIPGKLDVLDNVGLNEQFGRDILSRVMPLLASTSTLEGKASLWVKDVKLPLGEKLTSGGAGSGRLDLSDVRLRPTGVMATVMKLVNMGSDKPYPIKVSGVDFELKDGALSFDNLSITVNGFELKFRGRVKFDDSVEIIISVPVQAGLLDALGVKGPVAQYAKALEGVRVDIPLGGTRLFPKLDLAKVNPKPLVEQAIKKIGGSLLPGLPKLP